MPGDFELDLITRAHTAASEYLKTAADGPFANYLQHMESQGYGPELAKQMFWSLGCSVRWDMTIDMSSLLARR